MRVRTVARSLALGLAAIMSVASIAVADTVGGDADVLTAGAQASRYLGEVAPGAVLHVPIDFRLTCKGFSHVDPGQMILLSVSTTTVPAGGSASATDGVVGPVPATWADDTQGASGCPSPAPTPLSGSTLSEATLVAPSTPGGPYAYSFLFDRSLAPAGTGDGTALTSITAVSFSLTVVANTPPALGLPADATHEGNTTGGWIGTWSASATDAEDNPPPTPSCDPPAGTLFPLGTTVVDCTVADSGGLTAQGSFSLRVEDTTAPTFVTVPSSVGAVTAIGGGVAVTYVKPTATDIVDPDPHVACAPASGSTFPVGTTTVHCRATDASGNVSSAGFPVTVSWLRAVFGAPVGPDGTVTIRSARTLPVKVTILRDGVIDASGPVSVRLSELGSCPTDTSGIRARRGSSSHARTSTVPAAVPLTLQGGGDRWSAELDLSAWALAPGECYRADVVDDGVVVGGFTIVVAG